MLWASIVIVVITLLLVPLLRFWCGRTPSQNVVFNGKSPDDPDDHPPGHAIAKTLLHGLRADGFSAADEDNWRDCGWSIDVALSAVQIEVSCAQSGKPELWICQVSVLNDTAPFAQILGRKFIDRSAEVLAVSQCVHKYLQHAGYTGILWCINDFPDAVSGSPEPRMAPND